MDDVDLQTIVAAVELDLQARRAAKQRAGIAARKAAGLPWGAGVVGCTPLQEETNARNRAQWIERRKALYDANCSQLGPLITELYLQMTTDADIVRVLTAQGYRNWHGKPLNPLYVRRAMLRYHKLTNSPLPAEVAERIRRARLSYHRGREYAETLAKVRPIIEPLIRAGMSTRKMCPILAAHGILGRNGKPLAHCIVHRYVVALKNCTPVQKYRDRPARRTGPKIEHHIG